MKPYMPPTPENYQQVLRDIHGRAIQMWAGCIWVPIYEVMTRKHLTLVTLEENLEMEAFTLRRQRGLALQAVPRAQGEPSEPALERAEQVRKAVALAHDPLDMARRAHHRPIMTDRLHIIKLGQSGLGHCLQRFACGV